MGAGLPVLSTLKTLLDTGDEVQRIEGVFRSGVLLGAGCCWVPMNCWLVTLLPRREWGVGSVPRWRV